MHRVEEDMQCVDQLCSEGGSSPVQASSDAALACSLSVYE
jgi:hypothetical protein